TVSKVINKTGSISAKTIKKVEKIIEETGYQPSFSAKSLATQKSNLVGLIYSGDIQISHPFFNEVVNAFKNAIGKLGYDILVISSTRINENKENLGARCLHFQVNGCIIIAGEGYDKAVEALDRSNIPCVGVDIKLKGPRSSYVSTDNEKISAQVVEYLYLNSLKKVAFIGGPEDSIISNVRKDAFIHNMNLFGMSWKQDWIQYGDYFESSGYLAMKRILASNDYPQVIYTASDMMAFGALKALKEERIRVPEDMKIIGCDDLEACRYSDPPLATVKQEKDKMGKLEAYMLHDLINGKTDPSSILVDPNLIIRESCLIENEITIST